MTGYEHLTSTPAADMLRTAMRKRGFAGWDRRGLTQAEALAALAAPVAPRPILEDRPASLDELGALMERLSRG